MECLSGLFGKSREGYYRVSREKRQALELTEASIVSIVRQIRLEAPGIGAYKLFLILKDIYPGKMCGRDRFYRLMHDNGLMLKPYRKRHTTNSNHCYRKYRNLIKGFRPTGLNQLWVADITYIETDEGVCYLHLLTDAFTHEIIGWRLADSLKAVHTADALRQGISLVGSYGLAGLIHHSDRGVQYCCGEYTGLLRSIGARISMTEDYSPTDNAVAERVNGIIKQEWLYRMKRPADTAEAERLLGDIIEFYNERRPHMSNQDRLPPRRLRRWLFRSGARP